LDLQVIVQKLGTIGIISYNATYFCCRQENIFGFFCAKKSGYGLLVAQVKLGRGTGYKISVKPSLSSFAHEWQNLPFHDGPLYIF
jgi:hypothetical protein